MMAPLSALAVLLVMMPAASAQLDSDGAHVLKGSGFAISESTVKAAQLDLVMSIESSSSGRAPVSIADGLFTLEGRTYRADKVDGTLLRDGKFLRIAGTATGSPDDIQVRILGKLVEDAAGSTVYVFTGRITERGVEYKIVYAAATSEFTSSISADTPQSTTENTVRIVEGASKQDFGKDYNERTAGGKYFVPDNIRVSPGQSVTIINDDDVTHRIISGSAGGDTRVSAENFVLCADKDTRKKLKGYEFGDSACTFTADGRIDTGAIKPGKSVTISFEEGGFYRLINPEYPWMSITGFAFKNLDNRVIGSG